MLLHLRPVQQGLEEHLRRKAAAGGPAAPGTQRPARPPLGGSRGRRPGRPARPRRWRAPRRSPGGAGGPRRDDRPLHQNGNGLHPLHLAEGEGDTVVGQGQVHVGEAAVLLREVDGAHPVLQHRRGDLMGPGGEGKVSPSERGPDSRTSTRALRTSSPWGGGASRRRGRDPPPRPRRCRGQRGR